MSNSGGLTDQELEIRNALVELDEAIPIAVKIQREQGDTDGALNMLREIVKAALLVCTKKGSYEYFNKLLVMEKAIDKARLVHQRVNHQMHAVACGMVAYYMTARRLAASADACSRRASELRSPQNPLLLHDIESKEEIEESAKFEEEMAGTELAKAYAALSNEAIINESTRLLKKMKLDVSMAERMLSVFREPSDNPLKMFNAFLSVLK